ncbi:LUD domain-containing protein [Halapricum desulfuricans]|uniref:L-lactate utilization protein LutC, contains LUDdomain n=1 Tax=Halapricum desulfuricans TaxID=2841257 RepID=A0A897NQW6_9EURY|nr:LUD domain-containing protein [Halapricum desulfuricans]QSG14834.1 L-lactate utilization protein LutC, contains LUDdomain [Halapricum desulfuricans]
MATTAGDSTSERFTTALDELDVGWRTTTAEALSETLTAFPEPIVGAPLPFEGISLPNAITRADDPESVKAAASGVTAGTLGIADYGSVLIESTPPEAELVSLYADTHVAVVRESDIVDSMTAALESLGPRLREGRGNAIVATGPSATADMGALVEGVHGPGDVHVVIVE